MLLINDISNDPFQTMTVVTEEGLSFYLELYFIPLQLMWTIQKIVFNEQEINGIRICSSPNMLRQFKNLFPFGIACITEGNREPMFIDDFSSGASKLYLINENEVQEYEDYLSGN